MGSGDPLEVYTRWARQYGDIFHYRAFHRHIYFLNNPELVKYVLVDNYKCFIKGEAVRLNRRIFGNGRVDQRRLEFLVAGSDGSSNPPFHQHF